MSESAGTDKLNSLLRQLPQVEAVLNAAAIAGLLPDYRREVIKRLIAGELAMHRSSLSRGNGSAAPSVDDIAESVAARLAELQKPCIRPVVNATGVLLHTNLGRAVLGSRSRAWMDGIAAGYGNLEMDMASGERTRRDYALEPLLRALTGCEAATVVNNNAAAVFLILHAFCQGREVITSRGELVEIGGSYRVPDVVSSSGAILREVGTTNRTRIADYERVISSDSAMLLKTHPSNYSIEGFTEEASLAELCALGKRQGVMVYYDLGSGYFAPESGFAFAEPDVQSALDCGADLVSFSGDKLLGGPQAGIIIGKKKYIEVLRKSALWRILRIDKLTLAALGGALTDQLHPPGHSSNSSHIDSRIASPAELAQRAAELAEKLTALLPEWKVKTTELEGSYGGGSAPSQVISSQGVLLQSKRLSAADIDHIMRNGEPAVAGYMQRGEYVLNVLTLLPGDIERIAERFRGLS